MVDTTKLVGLLPAYTVDDDKVVFTASTKDTPPGVVYDLTLGDNPFVTLKGATFECTGPKGSVTCRAAGPADDIRIFDVASFQYQAAPRIGDLPDVDFYSVTIDAQLNLMAYPAVGCDPGGSGLLDPGPSCIFDTTATVGFENVSMSVDGAAPPSVQVFWDDPDGIVGSLMRIDDPAGWSYQNPDPVNADQGKWLFSPAEIDTVIVELHNLFAAVLDFTEGVHVTPWKWAYGYGPPQPGSGVMVL